MNFLLGAGFKVSRAPNVFIMGRFAESGVLNDYLLDQCKSNKVELCKYVNRIPSTSGLFLWDDNSPLYEGGCVDKDGHRSDCWLLKNEEYSPIIEEVFTTTKIFKEIHSI